jgi:hypothetical protein
MKTKALFPILCLALASITGFTACNQGGAVSNEARQEELYSMVVFSKGSEYFNWAMPAL